jgi:hypothetical protein
MIERLRATVSLISFLVCFAAIANAEPTAKDIQAISKTLGFVQLPAHATIFAIIYDPANAASQKSAEHLQSVMGDNFLAGDTTLAVKLVPLGDIAAATDIGVLYPVEGLGASGKAITDASKAKRVPCVTENIELVRSGVCAIGVKSELKLRIVVNRAVSDQVGLTFDPAFSMLVTEI